MMKKMFSVILLFAVLSALLSFAGARAPAAEWAEEYILRADGIGITQGIDAAWQENISRERFCALAHNLLSVLCVEMPAAEESLYTDTDDQKINALSSIGIINGKGNRRFAPTDALTREEAAAVLHRIAKHLALEIPAEDRVFSDSGAVSAWAKDAVRDMCALGIMNGVSESAFSPKGGFTAEQAVTTMVRMYELCSSGLSFADRMNTFMPSDRNYMFSPFSIKTALMMVANGAVGQTRDEIMKTLDVSDIDEYNTSIRETIKKYSETDILTLSIANSIWLNTDETAERFQASYTRKMKDVFSATFDEITNANGCDKINAWCSEKTRGLIPNIITETNFEYMLINAVYFKGKWTDAFNERYTKPDTFHNRDGTAGTADFMYKWDHMRYTETNGVQIVSLPYSTREDILDENGKLIGRNELENVNIRMYFMMSDSPFSPSAVLDTASSAYNYRDIKLYVPKFKMTFEERGMKDILGELGMSRVLTDLSEATNIITGPFPLKIKDVIHKTFIEVNEKETVAAAVTGVMAAGGTGAYVPPLTVRFDKPFTFVVKDEISGEVLFMGEYAFAEEN